MEIKPFMNSSTGKKEQVEGMFSSIAPRYDFLNHFLSFGIDHYWRSKAVKALKTNTKPAISNTLILDVATGTGDLAIAVSRIHPEKIFGIDLSEEMLEIGKKKIKKKNLSAVIELLQGDSENLIFEDNKFDAITVSFGVRNFEDLLKGLQEFRRVLKPGGVAVILEFSKPKSKLIRSVYHFYSSKILPALGKRISGNEVAYQYLFESVEAFPSGGDFLKILEKAGFKETKCKPLSFGIVSVYTGKK